MPKNVKECLQVPSPCQGWSTPKNTGCIRHTVRARRSARRTYRYFMKTTNDIQLCRPEKDTRWRSWFRHCATIRKTTILILDSVVFPGVDSASNRNEYQGTKGGRCLGITTLPASCADFLESLGASTSWSPEGQ